MVAYTDYHSAFAGTQHQDVHLDVTAGQYVWVGVADHLPRVIKPGLFIR